MEALSRATIDDDFETTRLEWRSPSPAATKASAAVSAAPAAAETHSRSSHRRWIVSPSDQLVWATGGRLGPYGQRGVRWKRQPPTSLADVVEVALAGCRCFRAVRRRPLRCCRTPCVSCSSRSPYSQQWYAMRRNVEKIARMELVVKSLACGRLRESNRRPLDHHRKLGIAHAGRLEFATSTGRRGRCRCSSCNTWSDKPATYVMHAASIVRELGIAIELAGVLGHTTLCWLLPGQPTVCQCRAYDGADENCDSNLRAKLRRNLHMGHEAETVW